MFKRLTIFLMLIIGIATSHAQEYKLNSEVAPLEAVDRLDLPALNNHALLKQYTHANKATANRFAEAREVNITPQLNGTWESTKSDMAVWRHIIKSPNAHTINLGFTEFELPESARLFIYSISKDDILGPFTKADNDVHMQLWTPIIEGDEIVIELQVEASEAKKVKLTLSKINHDFRDIRKSLISGSCNLDVICGAADGWASVDQYRDIISSVGAYSYNGIDQCSGVLINNARNDCKPYFLTAEHCGISNANAPSVVVYWNYQNSYCRQPGTPDSGRQGDGSRDNFNSGAILRADLGASDFALIELDDPLDTQLDLHLAGWSVEKVLPDTSICIHHPGVEEKRISFEYDRLDYDPTGLDTTHLLVNDWDIGTTEGGSSGSPLFNTKKQIIGQLTGGLAACGNNEYDSYGWLNWSWTGGGTVSSSLKPWLDPDNLGVTQLNGRNCNYSVLTGSAQFEVCGLDLDMIQVSIHPGGLFNDIVNYSFEGIPQELDAEFQFDSGTVDDINSLTINGFSGYRGSSFNFTVHISDGFNEASSAIAVEFDENLPRIPVGSTPDDNEQNVSLSPRLSVKKDQGKMYQFELAEDSNFESIIVSDQTDINYLDISGLEENTTYYWRAKGINLCGDSDWSETNEFTTAPVFCTRIHYESDPVEISPNTPGKVSAEINFPYGVMVESLTLPNVTGDHEYVGDLVFSLNYGDASSTLLSEVCDEYQNFDVGFSDESLLLALPCPPTDGKLYKPLSPLSVFNREFAGGSWELEIEDTAFLDGGQLNDWSMDVCFSNPALSVIIPRDHRIYNCNENVVIETYIYSEETNDWHIKVSDADHNELDIDYSQNASHANSKFVTLLDKNQLSTGKNFLTIQLIDNNNGNILAFATVTLNIEEDIGVPLIDFPVNDSEIGVADFSHIDWQTNYDGQFITDIALDEYFKEIIWSEGGSNANSLLIEEAFEKGVYYLRVRLISDNCESASPTVKFTVGMGVSTDDLDNSTIRLYPNPVSDILIMEGDLDQFSTFTLIDLNGRTILKDQIEIRNSVGSIDMSTIDEGIYIAIINSGEKYFRQKIVKF